MLLSLECAHKSPESLVRMQILHFAVPLKLTQYCKSTIPQFKKNADSDSTGLVGAQDSLFLTNSHVMSKLLFPGPHFEN